MNRARADFLLFVVALIWGSAFVAQKDGNAYIGPLLFIGVRFLAASAFLAPLVVWEARRAPPALARADWTGALWICLCLCAGCWTQQIGLQTTTATNAGFITAVYMVIVPFVAWVFTGRPPRALVLLAGAVALSGAWLLAGGGRGFDAWSRGDLIIFSGDFLWALHITLVGQCKGMAARPILLSFLQCLFTGAVTLPVALLWQPAAPQAVLAALPALLYAGVLSSGVAFTMQIVAQRHTPPAEAALIMSLESVFAAVTGAIVMRDTLAPLATFGAVLILVGVVLVESGSLLPGYLALLRARQSR
jgi:drug/metabolite transporter (DMT)-like permease